MPTQAETITYTALKEIEVALTSETPNYQVIPLVRQALKAAEVACPELAVIVEEVKVVIDDVPALKKIVDEIEAKVEAKVEKIEATIESDLKKVIGKESAPAAAEKKEPAPSDGAQASK